MLSALPFLTCKLTEINPVTVPAGFNWQGHRGCRGLLPENSIPAFIKALEFPEVVTLELDLAVTKDNQLIVSHEPWFNPNICRQPGGQPIAAADSVRFLIHQMTVDEVQAFDCGSQGNPRFPGQQKMPTYKPTLREVVAEVCARYPGRSVRWNMEIKSQPEWDGVRTPPIGAFAQLVVQALHELRLTDNTTVQSFDVRALQAVRQIAPQQRLALLTENALSLEYNLNKLGFQPAVYSPYYLLVDQKLVRRCHSRGIQVIPWTVNDVPAMRRLIRLGVDGIITDYPDKIASVSQAN